MPLPSAFRDDIDPNCYMIAAVVFGTGVMEDRRSAIACW
jgi:hypothetical protein